MVALLDLSAGRRRCLRGRSAECERQAGGVPIDTYDLAGTAQRDEGHPTVLAAKADIGREEIARFDLLRRSALGRKDQYGALAGRSAADAPGAVDGQGVELAEARHAGQQVAAQRRWPTRPNDTLPCT